MSIKNFFKKLFHRDLAYLQFDPKSNTIPEAFDFPLAQYDLLVNELTNLINPSDRLGSLDAYLKNAIFQKYNIDLNKPKHAALLGYAFASAIFLQRELQQKVAVQNVLKTFYPEVVKNEPKLSN